MGKLRHNKRSHSEKQTILWINFQVSEISQLKRLAKAWRIIRLVLTDEKQFVKGVTISLILIGGSPPMSWRDASASGNNDKNNTISFDRLIHYLINALCLQCGAKSIYWPQGTLKYCRLLRFKKVSEIFESEIFVPIPVCLCRKKNSITVL